jgi:hypothetical protein
MNNLGILKRQHGEIYELIKNINTLISTNLESNINNIAFQINTLSGKLKMHLMSEDKFPVPFTDAQQPSESKGYSERI